MKKPATDRHSRVRIIATTKTVTEVHFAVTGVGAKAAALAAKAAVLRQS